MTHTGKRCIVLQVRVSDEDEYASTDVESRQGTGRVFNYSVGFIVSDSLFSSFHGYQWCKSINPKSRNQVSNFLLGLAFSNPLSGLQVQTQELGWLLSQLPLLVMS